MAAFFFAAAPTIRHHSSFRRGPEVLCDRFERSEGLHIGLVLQGIHATRIEEIITPGRHAEH